MNNEIGTLIYKTLVDNEINTIEIDIYLDEKSVSGTEFYKAIQSGIDVAITFETRKSDFDLTKHLEKDTNKPLYATQVKYDGAVYDIIRHYKKPNTNDVIVIICS